MDADELRALWAEHNDRPAFVREHRDAIHEHTDVSEEIPDGSLAQVRRWLERFKGTVTRQLGETTKADDDESGDNS